MSGTYEEATCSAHKKRRTFTWSPTMIEDFLKCLHSRKISMDCKGKNFDGDTFCFISSTVLGS